MMLCRRFLAALSFLTRIPVPRGLYMDADALAQSPPMFPVVGALIGFMVAGFDRFARAILSPQVAAAADVAVGFVLTAGLHFDGLIDTADGLLSGKPCERALEIMRDSRVGAMGVLAGVLVVALEVAAVAALPDRRRFAALTVTPAVARYLMAVAMTVFPYARTGVGLGRLFAQNRSKKKIVFELACSGLAVMALVFYMAHTPGLVAFGACSLLALMVGRSASTYLGGLTGDVYGALCVLTEVGMYMILSARW